MLNGRRLIRRTEGKSCDPSSLSWSWGNMWMKICHVSKLQWSQDCNIFSKIWTATQIHVPEVRLTGTEGNRTDTVTDSPTAAIYSTCNTVTPSLSFSYSSLPLTPSPTHYLPPSFPNACPQTRSRQRSIFHHRPTAIKRTLTVIFSSKIKPGVASPAQNSTTRRYSRLHSGKSLRKIFVITGTSSLLNSIPHFPSTSVFQLSS